MSRRSELIQAAQGKRDCDLVLENARWLDVFTATFREGHLAVYDGAIVGVGPEARLPAKRVVDLGGKAVVPGFIDAHVHLESSLMTPSNFQRCVLPKGTTTAVCDPHELANVLGAPGVRYFLEASETLGLSLKVMMSSCVPATTFETNGGGSLSAAELSALAAHPSALGLAEVMNVPGVLHGDPSLLEKLDAFEGRPIDGHCPLLRGQALSAYAAAGISSCHESSELEEAREKLSKGVRVWIREGSVAKDLDALLPLLDLASSTSLGFCTDDRNPLDIAREGHVDHLVRSAIARGVPPEVVFRTASYSVASHYGLASHAARARVGAIAPGFTADLVVLGDVQTCAIDAVYKAGKLAEEVLASQVAGAGARTGNTVRCALPEASELEGPAGQVHVIGVRHGRILTDRSVEDSAARGVARLSVLERHGHGRPPSNGYVRGFGERFAGAIASSVGHDSHNLIVVGSDTSDMRRALAALAALGGGFVVVRRGEVLAELALPEGGLMSAASPEELKVALEGLHGASRAVGCELPEPFLQLAFLSLPVIPSLKLTDHGLMDVDRFELIPVRAA
ncbi:MAG: adenine deaminase [Myxococcales bacterium]|nr:adenine deaminase [Myxococcales bacterium]HQY60797.1 adenine deaminase [Polyangiaceae bacterium]